MTTASPTDRNSQIDWLDSIPPDWLTKPLFAVARSSPRSNSDLSETNLLSLSFGRIIRKDIATNDGLLPASFETYQIVEPGDIVFRFTDLQNDKRSLRNAIVTERGIITSAYLALTPTHCVPEYLNYLMRSYDASKVFYSMGGGLRQSLKFDDVKRLPVLMPPTELQRMIIEFLDHETAQIDELIGKQNALIELLGERRKAVIAKAVTKGLNAQALMKSSGVDWIGEIPESWELSAMRYLCDITTGSRDTVNAVPDGKYPFFVRSQQVESIMSYGFDGEAVLTAGDGAGVGKVFHHFTGKFDAHQRVYVMSRFRRVSGRFLFYYMETLFAKVVLEGTAKSTVESLRRPMLAGFQITVPPPDDQADILRFVEEATAAIDNLIVKAQRAISLLRERRSALITAAVTGKIDVRGAA